VKLLRVENTNFIELSEMKIINKCELYQPPT